VIEKIKINQKIIVRSVYDDPNDETGCRGF